MGFRINQQDAAVINIVIYKIIRMVKSYFGDELMGNTGKKRTDPRGAQDKKLKNAQKPVPEIKGKARSGKEHAGPM